MVVIYREELIDYQKRLNGNSRCIRVNLDRITTNIGKLRENKRKIIKSAADKIKISPSVNKYNI